MATNKSHNQSNEQISSSINTHAVFDRLKQAAGVSTNTDLGRVLGISQASVSQAKAKGRIPADWFIVISYKYGVSIDWLVYGVGPMRRDQAAELDVLQKQLRQLESQNEDLRGKLLENKIQPEKDLIVPVVGLAGCGLHGWEIRSPTTMYAAAPPDIAQAKGFAVVAVGESMAPAGIMPGYLLFCDPGQQPIPGDIVYAEKKDGHATVKRYLGEHTRDGSEFVTLEGWLPRRDHSTPPSTPPQSFSLEVKRAAIQQIAPVIYIKRRL